MKTDRLISCAVTAQLISPFVFALAKSIFSNDAVQLIFYSVCAQGGGGVAQWLGLWISDQGVPGSNPGRCTFRCGLGQVTFTLLSSG